MVGGGGGSKPTDKNLLEISLLKGEYEDYTWGVRPEPSRHETECNWNS